MGEFSGLGKILLIAGLVLAGVGLLFVVGGKIPWVGRLPGDFCFKGKNFTFYFPLTTSILISVILSIIFYLFFRK
ncbi:MAG: DUF2905 domain-containing protein [Syntrophales bacterium]|jgi:hypothetical protein|nr:DUF2905 domain-containing protein [Syntrophales bacterium]MDD5533538.1 DUF2905 domain-containing protein [Syntrophales bacterium]HPL62741.1 DUF2905 domain-containing protein [Syntrophales bacterium]